MSNVNVIQLLSQILIVISWFKFQTMVLFLKQQKFYLKKLQTCCLIVTLVFELGGISTSVTKRFALKIKNKIKRPPKNLIVHYCILYVGAHRYHSIFLHGTVVARCNCK